MRDNVGIGEHRGATKKNFSLSESCARGVASAVWVSMQASHIRVCVLLMSALLALGFFGALGYVIFVAEPSPYFSIGISPPPPPLVLHNAAVDAAFVAASVDTTSTTDAAGKLTGKRARSRGSIVRMNGHRRTRRQSQ